MEGEFFKGDVKDVCEFLKEEATRCKGMTAKAWLQYRELKRIIDKQFAEMEKE